MKQKKKTLVLFSQEIIGSWAGELEVSGTKLPLIFNIKQKDAELITTMDSPMQGAKDIPITKTNFEPEMRSQEENVCDVVIP